MLLPLQLLLLLQLLTAFDSILGIPTKGSGNGTSLSVTHQPDMADCDKKADRSAT